MFRIGSLKTNAFLEPNDPNAVFPQRKKENNIDFRSTAVANSGLTVRFTSRKNVPGSTKQCSKFDTIVKTRAELDEEERMAVINAKQEDKKRVDDDLNASKKILEQMVLEPKVKEVDMQVDDKQKQMLKKTADDNAINKKKRGKRGNKRTLVY